MKLLIDRRANIKATVLLIIIATFLALLLIGLNFDFILYLIVLIPLVLLVFSRWPVGNWRAKARSHVVSSLVLGLMFFIIVVGYIIVFGAGQLGSGDELKIQGHHITWKGLLYLLEQSIFTTALVFSAAMLTSAIAK